MNPETVKIITHHNAVDFLNHTQSALESNEAGNSLILGVCATIAEHPERTQITPCLKTVADREGLVIAAMMTPPHKLVLYGHQGDIEAGAQTLAANLHADGWQVPGANGPGNAPQFFSEQWFALTGCEYKLTHTLRVYALREIPHVVPVDGALRLATEDDSALLSSWWVAFQRDVFGEANPNDVKKAVMQRIAKGNQFVWDDGQPVSMANKTRPTRRGISITGVYTPPGYRGRGYATSCVSTLSQLLLDSGWEFCALFADLDNPISNRLYLRIGYKPVCDYTEFSFHQPVTHNIIIG